MKLLVFTPAIKISAVGRLACLVVRALIARGCEVTVVRTEDEELLEKPVHDFGTKLIRWNDSNQVVGVSGEVDAVVYHIGDNYALHKGCIEWISALPGLVCLHDFFLGHLFYEWAQTNQPKANATLRNWYGNSVEKSFHDYRTCEEFIAATFYSSPMTEWISSMSYGVVAHSIWGIERVISSCPGPVHIVPLISCVPKDLASSSPVSCALGCRQLKVLVVGPINSSNRVASVIRAIGNSEVLRQHSLFRLAGKINPEMIIELSALARKCQVNIIVSDDVDDCMLSQYLEQADVVSCLRWPNPESVSATVIESMLSCKATIVTDTGFYREIPDSVLIKIDIENELWELQSALESFYEDIEAKRSLGDRRQQCSSVTYTAENYAEDLLEVSTLISRAKPVIASADFFVDCMMRWGAEEDSAQIGAAVRSLHIFNSP